MNSLIVKETYLALCPADDGERRHLTGYESRFGYLPRFFVPFAFRKGLNRAIDEAAQFLTCGGSSLGSFREELLALAVSVRNGCGSCSAPHGEFLSKMVAGGRELAEDIARNPLAADLGEVVRAIMRYVKSLTVARDPAVIRAFLGADEGEPSGPTAGASSSAGGAQRVGAADVVALIRAGVDDEQIRVMFLTAWFAFSDRGAEGFGLMLEPFRSEWATALAGCSDGLRSESP